MIHPEPVSKTQLLEDEKFLLDLGRATLHGNLPMKTVEHLFGVASRLLAAVKYEQGQRMTPVTDLPPSTEDVSSLELRKLQIEKKIGAQICWMENISFASVPIGWGDCVGLLWEEDECLLRDETAPHLPWALHRFVGFHSLEELGPKLDRIDNGDSGLDLYSGGWVRIWSYNGDGLGRVYRVIRSEDGDEISLEGMSPVEEWGLEDEVSQVHRFKRSGGGL